MQSLAQISHHSQRRSSRRRGVALSVELVMVLPILFAVLLATVEFGILLMASQGLAAAANIGAREAALPSADYASVTTAVQTALDGYVWKTDPQLEVSIFVNGNIDRGPLFPPEELAAAITGDVVSVVVSIPMDRVAPDALKFVGISIAGRELRSTFVTRRE